MYYNSITLQQMKLPIYLLGHSVLRAHTEEIAEATPELKTLIADMYETMYDASGVGLAAPQIGRKLRMFVIDGSPLAEDFPECAGSKMTIINPELEVIEDVQPVTREEGCLSVPGMSEPVKRTEHIRLSWLDEDMKPHEREFSGFLSRIIQHEYDHLEGIVYVDRISGIRKQLAKGKIKNIEKGNVSCTYRTRAASNKK